MRKSQCNVVAILLFLLAPVALHTAAAKDGSDSLPAATAAPAPEAAAEPARVPAKGSKESRVEVGVGVKVSTLGIGGEAAVQLSHRSNVRVGFNAFSYGDNFTKDGANYKGTLSLRSLQATYDLFLIGGLHLSPGVLVYNGNKVTANVSVPGGQTFTLSNVNYLSDAADPIGGTGKLSIYKAAPMVLIGFGNLVARSHHFSTTFEIGAAYQGPPRITLNLTGSACDPTGLNCRSVSADPTIQANVVSEEAKLNKSASPYKFYPVVSFGVGYKF